MANELPKAIWDADAYTRLGTPQTSWGERVLARLGLSGDETVLDAGCGTGKLTKELLERLPRGRVIAVDRDPNMVEATRRALAPVYGARVEVREADLATLALDEPVDVVFSTATLHWVLDHDRLFAALFRALRPGGRLVAQLGGPGNLASVRERLAKHVKEPDLAPFFEGWPGPWLFPEEADTQRRLERAGFVDVATHVHAAPTPFADEAGYRDFLARIILVAHLPRIPSPKLRDRLVDAIVADARNDMPPFVLDYVRLDVSARRPSA